MSRSVKRFCSVNDALWMGDRLFAKVTKTDNCWNWNGCVNNMGYGMINFGNVPRLAHRISWMISNGEIQDDMCVLHKCDNPLCVRPDHLFLGTRQANMRDMITKERQCRGEAKSNSKLSALAVRIARRLNLEHRMSIKDIASVFSVDRRVMYDVIKGRSWKHVPMP
jgi:hypothetical protein